MIVERVKSIRADTGEVEYVDLYTPETPEDEERLRQMKAEPPMDFAQRAAELEREKKQSKKRR